MEENVIPKGGQEKKVYDIYRVLRLALAFDLHHGHFCTNIEGD